MPSSLWAYLDDLAALMRATAVGTSPGKIAIAAKSATTKTMGIVADDLAIKSKGVVGLDPKREGPIVAKIYKRCLQNLCWILPSTFALTIVAPQLLPVVTALGGAFLTYEGAESLHHMIKEKFGKGGHGDDHGSGPAHTQSAEEIENRLVHTQSKIGIVNSLELTLIAMATVATQDLATRMGSVAVNAFAMATIVHGLVFGIVRMDDVGHHLVLKEGDGVLAKAQRGLGRGLLKTLPWIMNKLPAVGLTAMFTVGGELVGKNIPVVEHALHTIEHAAHSLMPAISILPATAEFLAGVACTGAIGLAVGFTCEKAAKIVSPYAGAIFNKVKTIGAGFRKAEQLDVSAEPDTKPPVFTVKYDGATVSPPVTPTPSTAPAFEQAAAGQPAESIRENSRAEVVPYMAGYTPS